MKLFYITRVNIPSGAAQSVQISSMCEAFNQELLSFTLISPKNIENMNTESNFNWEKINLSTRYRYLEFILKIFNKVVKEKPSHIYTRDIVIAFVFSFFKLNVIYEAHKEPRTRTAHFLMKKLKSKKNFILITISKALKDFYLKEYSFSESKIFDYHDAVFIEKYDVLRKKDKSQLRKELNLPSEEIIIMHTGSLYPGRGAEHFETIIENFPNVLFIQVGGTKEDIKRYKNLYKKYKNIIFKEHQNIDNLIKYQMCADLLFYPMTKTTTTYWCCSPMKIFEYMATGVPILSSNVGSVSEVLNEQNSIPFNPDDKQTIIDGINIFFDKTDLVKEKSQKALQEVKEKYTWNKRANKILQFIKNKNEKI